MTAWASQPQTRHGHIMIDMACQAAIEARAQAGSVTMVAAEGDDLSLYSMRIRDLITGLAEDTIRRAVGYPDALCMCVVIDTQHSLVPLLSSAMAEVRTGLSMGGTWLTDLAVMAEGDQHGWLVDPDDLVLTGPGQALIAAASGEDDGR